MPSSFYEIWAFIFGLCFGSFSNVVALRDDDRKSILTGRSCCPHCHHVLRWYELIPLLSFFWQGGKCRSCGAKLSWRYPLTELVAGCLTAYLVWFGYLERGSILLTVGLTIAFFLLFIVSLIDLEKMLVPDGYVVAAGVIGGMTMIITHQNTWLEILLGLVIGAGSIAAIIGIWWLLFRQWGMGEGDIWIAGAIGLIVGYPTILIALFSSVVIGAVLGSLALMMSSWMKGESIQGAQCMKKAIPFGPFLFMGGLIALQWGHSIISWYILW